MSDLFEKRRYLNTNTTLYRSKHAHDVKSAYESISSHRFRISDLYESRIQQDQSLMQSGEMDIYDSNEFAISQFKYINGISDYAE